METSFSFLIVIIMLIFGGTTLALDVNVVTDFKAVGNGVADDTKAFEDAWAAVCTSKDILNHLIIPTPQTFLIKPTPKFEGPCKSIIIVLVMGSIVAPKESDAAWANRNDWLSFSNVNNLIVSGTSTGSINGRATFNDWWNCPKGKECPQDRPTGLGFHQCNNCQVVGLNSRNPPMNHLTINNCDGVTVKHVNFQAPTDSPNTDGIDISGSKNVQILDSFIGTGDDCIAINSGSAFIDITNLNCGPGHGISVGSLGNGVEPETAHDIHVKNCTFIATQNGARIKTVNGGSGFATHITFEEITLINTGNPIIIDQYYCPHGNCDHSPKSNAVEVSFVSFKDFRGTTSTKEAIDISCSSVKHCHNIVLDGINIMASNKGKVESNCSNADGITLINTVVPPVKCVSTTSIPATEGFISMPVDATDEQDHSKL